jgi:hypothetical protein
MSRAFGLKSASACLFGRCSTPGCRSDTGNGLEQPNPKSTTTMNTHVPPPAEPQDASLYYPTPVTPEEAFQAIGRLRREARDEIHRLIQFLDKTDDYVSRELEDAVDDNACDDNELDGPENGEDEDSDPAEPSLGSLSSSGGDQTHWGKFGSGDLEDEHDGAEPDDNEGGDGAKEDDEPSLGWTLNGQGGGTSPEGDECETGGSVGAADQTNWVGSGGHDTGMAPAAMKAIRGRYKRFDQHVTNADGKHVDTEGGFGGFKRLRNLSDRQKKIVAPRLDRDAVHLT